MQKLPFIQLALVAAMVGAIAPASWADSAAFSPELPPATTDSSATPDSLTTTDPFATPDPVEPTAPVTLGTDTAIVVQFPIALTLTVEEGQPYPISLPLAQDILDGDGNVVIPAASPVSLSLQPHEGGMQLVAESVVVNGQLIAMAGLGPIIPGTTVAYEDANANAANSSAVFSDLFANAAGLMSNGDPNTYTQGAMLGSVVGAITGLSSADTAQVVQIPQGATYVLSLTTPVTF